MLLPLRALAGPTVALGLAATLLIAEPALGQVRDEAPYLGQIVSPTDFGGIGLMQMRTARMGPDGLLNIGYSGVYPYKKYFMNVHALPWAEATFRYTEVQNRLYSNVPTFSGTQTYKDRSMDLKFRVLREGDKVPEVAVGFQDLLGTGVFQGEYLVGSKRYYDIDFTLGLAWGYVGSRGTLPNPLRSLFSSFAPAGGQGGQLNLARFFSGNTMGAFGGVEYHTPLEGLSLKLEYDSHDYAKEALDNPQRVKSPINFGLNFQPYPFVDIAIGRERGNTYMARISLRANLNQQNEMPKFDPPPPPIEPRKTIAELVLPAGAAAGPAIAPAPVRPPPPVELAAPAAAPVAPRATDAAARIFDTLAGFGLAVDDVALAGAEMQVSVTLSLRRPSLAAAAQGALATAPPDVAAVTIVATGVGIGRAVRSAGSSSPTGGNAFGALDDAGLSVVDLQIVDGVAEIAVTRTAVPRLLDLPTVIRRTQEGLGVLALEVSFGNELPPPDRGEDAPPQAAILPNAGAGDDFRLEPVELYTASEKEAIRRRTAAALDANGFFMESLDFDGRRAVAEVVLSKFQQVARNYGYVARIVANNLPAPIEEITIAAVSAGMQVSRITFRRSDLERSATPNGTPEEVFAGAQIEEGQPGWPGRSATPPGRYPHFSWGITPQTRQHIGGPDQFILYQFWVAFDGGVDLGRGLSLQGRVGKNIYNNFDKISLASDSHLPHVRSDIKNYLQQGADNLVRLEADYYLKLAPDLYGRLSAGIFEEMYGGVSSEVLYRPFNSRLSLGLEVDRVQQRNYDQRLTFLPYKVTTGHFSLYYEMPYAGLLGAAHIGKYLAGDHGVTFELSRRFDSGVRMGAWATFTNVPANLFGEGSFDKGFFIVIPFDLFVTHSTSASGVFAFRPLYRDGGERLIIASRLYDVTGTGNLDAVTRDWPQLFR